MSVSKTCVVLLLLGWTTPSHSQSPEISQRATAWPSFDDLLELRQIDEMAVSPDGRWVAYVLAPVFEYPDLSNRTRIAFRSLKDGRSRVLEVADRPHSLRWSPRGDLSFLMKGAGRTKIWQSAPSDTAAKPVPLGSDSIGGEILAYDWSPAGDAVAYLAADPASARRQAHSTGTRDRLVLFGDVPGNFTGPSAPVWERDTLGAYVAIAPLSGQDSQIIRRQVVSWKGGPEIEWLRTGELGVVGAPLNASADQLFYERSVTIIDPRSGASRPLLGNRGEAPRYPAWSPSGHRLAYLQFHRPSIDPARPLVAYAIHAVVRQAGANKMLLSQQLDGLWDGLRPLWSADERTLFIGRYERGSARLFAIDMRTRRWRAITPDTLSVSQYALANDGRHLLAVLENANQTRELFRLNPASGALTRLTREGQVLSGLPLGQVDPVSWRSADGRFTVHGFLLKPHAYDPTLRYPLIVMVHGGPGVFYTNSFMSLRFESRLPPPQLLAAAGYLVFQPNPRGDSSYGEEFQAALNGDLASGPFRDVDTGVSTLVARGLVDSTAMAVYGVSYGGYLAAYTITQTHRYAAAAIDDGPINLTSLFGQEYALATMSLRLRLGGTPWSRPEAYASQSPITFVDRVQTPVLMRYGGRSASAADAIRFSLLAQGFEFYAGLKEGNVPVEFVLHPDQGHGIADWSLYRDWVGRVVTWFSRWLPSGGRD